MIKVGTSAEYKDGFNKQKNLIMCDQNIINIIRNDPKFFNIIYNQYINLIYKYVYNRTGNKEDSEDITSQVFLTALEGINKYKENGNLIGWLFGITKNKLKDYYKFSKKASLAFELLHQNSKEKVSEDLEQKEGLDALLTIIKTLSLEEQELLRLRFGARLKFSQISKILRKSEEATKKRTYRLIKKIGSLLEDQNG